MQNAVVWKPGLKGNCSMVLEGDYGGPLRAARIMPGANRRRA
jgi:hypothetical protein